MLLSSLIDADVAAPAGVERIDVVGVSSDSRHVRPGFVFVAIAGSKADGARFIADAVAKGAVAVVAGAEADVGGSETARSVPVLRAADTRRALALMAARFYDAQPETVVAVTGTSGKTSVADFARQIFTALGHKSASLGTIGLVSPDGAVYGSLTTPDPVALHQTLARLAKDGITHLAFEASSHGLDQHRLDGVRIKAAAVIAAVGPLGRRVMTVGRAGEDLKLQRLVREGFAQRMLVEGEGRVFDVRLPLLGEYQASNALVAAGLAIATGESAGRVLPALQSLKGVKGRLEIVGEARGGLAVVDYAHKPEALAAVLEALRPFATGRLICVMGCGGDRDKGKRPIMGAIAVEKADVVIVTDDNPRTEDPATIRAEILAGASGAREIGDRAQAIAAGVAMLGEGDVLVVAGKGHETGQIVGAEILPFSDHDELRAALGRLAS